MAKAAAQPALGSSLLRRMKRQWVLYLFLALPVICVILFNYVPMYGAVLAFKNYRPNRGILGSEWAGLKYFAQFFRSPNFSLLLKNTLILSLYSLVASLPIPILLALCLNEVHIPWFKKTVQMVTYAPYFISTVVMVGMLIQLMSVRTGFFNKIISSLGGTPIDFMAVPSLFRTIYVFSGVWQGMGYSAIIYIAALSNVDPQLYEAAIIDGASRLQKIVHIDIPAILPTIVLMLIVALGNVMSIGAEKVYLMQNNLNLSTSEIISTYVYKIGLIHGQFSLSTAVGLFNSVVNFVLIVLVNAAARRLGDTSLW